MKVLQLIDSLNPGGAERVAVNYANALVAKRVEVYICATREEGVLKSVINKGVGYLFLKKKTTLDLFAVLRLNRFIKKNKIDIIHAHSSSFFIGTCVKLSNRNIKLIWHDHYGNRPNISTYLQTFVLKQCSFFFNYIICVNTNLVSWSKVVLKHKKVGYLPNFAVLDIENTSSIVLKGNKGKRIVCLANLRPDKDHLNLLKAFSFIEKEVPDWTIHLVGNDEGDKYSESIKSFVSNKDLSKKVFFYGKQSSIFNILKQSDIGVLSSKSEGLPIALLEYGLAGLPTIVTDVGDCKKVVSNLESGLVILPEDSKALSGAILFCITNSAKASKMGNELKERVNKYYGENTTVDKLLKIYNK